MGWESFNVVTFDLEPLLQGQTRTDKLKSAYKSLIIDPRGSQCETNLQEIMDWESFDLVTFGLRSLLQGQTRTANLKVHITCLLLVLAVCKVERTYWVMGWESSHVFRFDLGSPPSWSKKDSKT